MAIMAQTIAEYWMEQGALRALRRILRHWLEQEQGNVPKTVLDRVTACGDSQRLEQAISDTFRVPNPEDLEL
jgi:hypothetical protein